MAVLAVLILGVVLLSPLIFPIPSLMYSPYNTFGEDIKMLKETGLMLILVLGLVVALWSAATSIFEEVEGKTALTILSKPITRRQFILGKYLGIVWPVAVLFIVLGLVFLVTISCKVVHDSRENLAADELTWQLCHWEMIRTVPGLLLEFMETLVLAAMSVAVSTRLPMLANLVICASIYARPPGAGPGAGQPGKFPIVAFAEPVSRHDPARFGPLSHPRRDRRRKRRAGHVSGMVRRLFRNLRRRRIATRASPLRGPRFGITNAHDCQPAGRHEPRAWLGDRVERLESANDSTFDGLSTLFSSRTSIRCGPNANPGSVNASDST